MEDERQQVKVILFDGERIITCMQDTIDLACEVGPRLPRRYEVGSPLPRVGGIAMVAIAAAWLDTQTECHREQR